MSLHKIIIADDENYITDSIDDIIDFNKHGFSIIGKFNNGNDVISFLKTNKVDAIITDIRMSKCSGLDIVNFINTNNLDVEIIFLTAYPSFEYAQFGIKNNIFDYILKPIDIDSISTTLNSLNVFLTKKKSAISNVVFKNHVPPGLQKIVSDFFSNKGVVTEADFKFAFSEFNPGINLENSLYAILNLQFIDLDNYLSDTWSHGREALMQAVQNLLSRENIFVCPFYTNFDNMSVLLISSDIHEKNSLSCIINDFTHQFFNDCIEFLDLHIKISTTEIFNNLSELMSFNYLLDSIDKYISYIFQNILSGRTHHAFDELEQLINSCNGSTSQSTYLVSSFIERMRTICKIYDIDFESLPQKLRYILLPKDSNSNNFVSTDELIEYATALSKQITNQPDFNPIQIAITYIKEHFTENITLGDVAKYISYTPPYLSKMLKKELNMPFVDYLNSLRLSYAAKLLKETNKNIESISTLSGYQSFNYFYKKFKLMYNCTPNVYRQNNQKHIFDIN